MSIYTSHLHVIYCVYHIHYVMATLTKEQSAVVLKAETLAETQDLSRRPSASWKHVTCMGLKPLHYLRTDPGRPSRGERRRMDGKPHSMDSIHQIWCIFFSHLHEPTVQSTGPMKARLSWKHAIQSQSSEPIGTRWAARSLVWTSWIRETKPSVSVSEWGRELTNRSLIWGGRDKHQMPPWSPTGGERPREGAGEQDVRRW